MRNYKIKGLILKRFNYGEADRFIWIISNENGLIQAKARGVRKIQAKLKGPLELFNISEIELIEGKSLDTITGANILESFENVKKNLRLTSKAFYLAELLLGFSAENEQGNLFALAETFFSRLNYYDDDLLIPKFIINLLDRSGFAPQLDHCYKCENDNFNNQLINFDLKNGGLICQNCFSSYNNKNKMITVSPKTVKLLRLLRKRKTKIRVEKKYIFEAQQILECFVESILEKKINSTRFLKEVDA
jgi:DNA repair protein RecO (recombination protein O)